MKLLNQPEDGATLYIPESLHPVLVQILRNRNEPVNFQGCKTIYGFVVNGSAILQVGRLNSHLSSGAYFSFPCPSEGSNEASLQVDGFVVLIQQEGFRGQVTVGAIEKHGRLSYIDGCSDSVLVYPPRVGDPCLNHLHLPPGIVQSEHTHPSIRVGVISSGRGHAYGRLPETGEQWSENLEPGCVFAIREQEVHAFRTDKTNEPLDVIAFHPDSDWGPSDDNHPMLNRTILQEQAATLS